MDEEHVLQEKRERRFRVLWVSKQLFLNLLLNPLRQGDTIRCITMTGMPSDCNVEDACYDWQRDAFGLRLYHPTFDIVEPGSTAMDIFPSFTSEVLQVVAPRHGPEFL